MRITRQKTRGEILAIAVDIASAEGLEALTIGRLAAGVAMSKSGVFAHFGSKRELQLATVETARAIAAAEVLRPARSASPGLSRLRALLENYLSYLERQVFRGGCFFLAASAELDGRPGPVRDRVVAVMRDWVHALETAVAEARARREIRSDLDDPQIAFELNALVMASNWSFQLHADALSFARARRAIADRLRGLGASLPPSGELA